MDEASVWYFSLNENFPKISHAKRQEEIFVEPQKGEIIKGPIFDQKLNK